MAQNSEPGRYTQGHSNNTVSTQQTRTVEADVAFLLPHIKKTDRILDVGCGPGTITTCFAKYANEGSTISIDISTSVLEKAKIFVAEANVPTQDPGSVVFEAGREP